MDKFGWWEEEIILCFFHYETQKISATVFFPSVFSFCLSFQRAGIEDSDPLPSVLLFLIGFKHSLMSSNFFSLPLLRQLKQKLHSAVIWQKRAVPGIHSREVTSKTDMETETHTAHQRTHCG